MSNSPQENVDFESALQQLEAMITKMSTGDLSLEESLKSFEEGVALARRCQRALTTAEQKVQQLIEQNGQPVLSPFDTEDI